MSGTLTSKPIPSLPAYPSTTVDATAVAAVSDGAVTYKATGLQVARGTMDSALAFIGTGTGAQARRAGDRLRDTVSIWDYGAAGDGTTDDTAAWQAALATGRSVTVGKPGEFRITAGLTVQGAGQQVIGSGRHACVFRAVGNFDVFTIIASDDTTRGAGLRHMRIDASQMTGGDAVRIYRHGQSTIEDVRIEQPHNGLNIARTNTVLISNCVVAAVRGAYGIRWWGDASNRSDILAISNTNLSGASFATPDLIDWDGNCHTLRLQAVGLITSGRGLLVRNTAGGTNPAGLFADGLEIDTSLQEGMRLEVGQLFYVSNLYQRLSQANHGIYIGASVSKARITGTAHGSYGAGVYIEGRDIEVDAHVYGNSNERSAKWSGVVVGGSARNVSFRGLSGVPGEGGTVKQRYGVEILGGAVRVQIEADLNGNVLGPWIDSSGGGRTNISVQATSSQAGVVQGVAMTTSRGWGAAADVSISGGAVTAVGLTNAGRGYESAPTVTIVGDGTDATATATVSAGGVATVTVTAGGSGYTWAEAVFSASTSDPCVRSHSAASPNLGFSVRASGTGAVRVGNDVATPLNVSTDVVSSEVPVRIPQFYVATLPSAATYDRALIFVRDGAGGKRLAVSNGVNWVFPDGTVVA